MRYLVFSVVPTTVCSGVSSELPLPKLSCALLKLVIPVLLLTYVSVSFSKVFEKTMKRTIYFDDVVTLVSGNHLSTEKSFRK